MLWEMETGARALNLDGKLEMLPGRDNSKPSTAGGDRQKSHPRLRKQVQKRGGMRHICGWKRAQGLRHCWVNEGVNECINEREIGTRAIAGCGKGGLIGLVIK